MHHSAEPGDVSRPAKRKAASRRKSATTAPKPKRISRRKKPEDMALEDWQIALRRQFGQEQEFRLKNVGDEPIFSEFEVTNPQTQGTYRIAIRDAALGSNYCSCPDFAINTLGTCKHIEFALARLVKKRGAKAAFNAGFHPEYSEVYLRYGSRRTVVFNPGTTCPESLKTLAGRYFGADGVLESRAYSRFHLFLKQATGGEHEVRCYDDALAFIAQMRDRESNARRVDKLFPDDGDSPAFRRLLKGQLYAYQREGARFAARAGRCLIADDMGLGKTVQAIAAVEMLARSAAVERVLIICPTSLKHQWQREIEKFTGRSAEVVEGLIPRRATIYASESFYKIVNYDVVHRDLASIRQWRPDLIILDEAQRIKNWQTRTAKTVKELRSDHAFVLTGTPLENRLEELHSIVEFVDRFRLGPLFRFLAGHQHLNENGRVIGYRNLSGISETLKPILIRRTKQEVLKELPERLEKRFFVAMTDEQRSIHEENGEIVARIVHKWKRHGFLSEADQHRLTCALQNMRMSCNSTYLLDQTTDHGQKTDELMALLDDILEQRETKAVIFSQWVRTHHLITSRLGKRKWGHVLFHGGVPGPKRRDLVRRFREDPSCRLFLSTDAGGVGLNLQNAAVVVNMDQPWNPAVLEQRIGRVHRLGQHRPVRVVHFIARATIEEGMLSLLSFKKSMFAGVLDGGRDEVFLGGTRLKRFMDSVDKATGSSSEPQPPAPTPSKVTKPESEKPAPKPAAPKAPSPDQAWAEVASAGVSLLEKLATAVSGGQGTAGQTPPAGLPSALIARDENTGRSYLKLPLPDPSVLGKIADAFKALSQTRQ